MNFRDKVVVVTGASKGFGEALARAFVAERAHIVITSNNRVELEKTATTIGADYFVADAASYDDTLALVDFVQNKFGRIDVWVNNAGIQIAPSPVESVSVDKLRKLFDINFFGYFYGCMAALPLMKRQGDGLIININSTAGLSGKPELSAYVSSKFAIKGLSESIREEIKNSDVKLFQVFPGGMQTDIYREEIPNDFDDYMSVDYAIDKVMQNLRLPSPEQNLVIRRPVK